MIQPCSVRVRRVVDLVYLLLSFIEDGGYITQRMWVVTESIPKHFEDKYLNRRDMERNVREEVSCLEHQ